MPVTIEFLAVIGGTYLLADLARDGKNDSPEADAIRDAMDAPWRAVTETERAKATELSESLYLGNR